MSMDGFVDDGSGQPLAKRPRPMGAGIRPLVPPRPSRIPTEPFHPPKCIFTHSGCLSTPETGGQLMIVVTPTCGHRWVCLACFSDPFKVDDYLKLTGSCPTCRDTGITDVKQLITISDSELMKQPCRWCRHKMRNMAFLPCLHISEYCTDCFDQAGNGFFANEEVRHDDPITAENSFLTTRVFDADRCAVSRSVRHASRSSPRPCTSDVAGGSSE